jgi:hypothetical protein
MMKSSDGGWAGSPEKRFTARSNEPHQAFDRGRAAAELRPELGEDERGLRGRGQVGGDLLPVVGRVLVVGVERDRPRHLLGGRVDLDRSGELADRDGVFGNDGRFHELAPAAQSSSACAGRAKDGTFISTSSVPPIPASGYTGAPGTSIGGCRERVNLQGPTVSPQTRRKLRGVPQCSLAGLRRVVAGFAGPRAATATLTASGYRKTLKLQPNENGAYLFVLRPIGLPSSAEHHRPQRHDLRSVCAQRLLRPRRAHPPIAAITADPSLLLCATSERLEPAGPALAWDELRASAGA